MTQNVAFFSELLMDIEQQVFYLEFLLIILFFLSILIVLLTDFIPKVILFAIFLCILLYSGIIIQQLLHNIDTFLEIASNSSNEKIFFNDMILDIMILEVRIRRIEILGGFLLILNSISLLIEVSKI